jgi:UDP-N-acetylmuramyl pentapeptide phosphotransferase/UDP-N-acetylglucosamine-1-phosphate transferase
MTLGMELWQLTAGFGVLISSAVVTAALIVLLRPLLIRYALARPNARSSHQIPTPQGGGVAVVFTVVGMTALLASGAFATPAWLEAPAIVLLTATCLIAAVGALDDIRPIGVVPRLMLQAIAAGALIAAIPAETRIVSELPWALERGLLLLGFIWFINLSNFMDGIDWMTVAEVVPITAGLVLIGLLGALPPYAIVVALTLCGALIGFAPFNKPVARLFLGDVGSLPIGLLLGWMLLLLAANGHLIAALILPLYYLADATVTLFRRLASGEKVWQAHRRHFYQRAIKGGFTVREVVARVFAVNVGLVALALVSILAPHIAIMSVSLIAASGLVGWLPFAFDRGRH